MFSFVLSEFSVVTAGGRRRGHQGRRRRRDFSAPRGHNPPLTPVAGVFPPVGSDRSGLGEGHGAGLVEQLLGEMLEAMFDRTPVPAHAGIQGREQQGMR